MKRTYYFLFFLLLCLNAHSQQVITTIVGRGSYGFSGDGGPALAAQLANATDVKVDAAGNIYIADANNNRVRKVGLNGIITTIAGNASTGYNGDGILATDAWLNYPVGLAIDKLGNVYIGDFYNNRVRKVDINGYISTFAGTGYSGNNGDGGLATDARLYYPSGIAVDKAGNVFIADQYNHRIRKVDINGIITTLAGSSIDNSNPGFSGDNGLAVLAKLNQPSFVAVDTIGNVYFSDQNNHRVRKVNSAGIISTIAGDGSQFYNGENIPASTASLKFPTGIAVDSAGTAVYVYSEGHSRVRKITTSGGMIKTVVGIGTYGTGTDGDLGTLTSLGAKGLCVFKGDTILIMDLVNQRVRKWPSPSIGLCVNGNIALTSDMAAAFYQWQYNSGSGYVPVSNNAYFSGFNQQTLQLTNIPSSWYGYKFRCQLNGSPNYSRIFIITFTNRWTGAINNDWENPGNWSCGSVPEANTDVIISGGTILVNVSTTVRTLVLQNGAGLTLAPGVVVTVTN